MEEKDVEQGLPAPHHHHLQGHRPDEKDLDFSSAENPSDAEPRFEPIRTAKSRRQSRDTSRARPLSRSSSGLQRERSNNGYGCDGGDDDDADAAGLEDASRTTEDEPGDPFLVGWDGGDNDPLNPRSMPTWRKWIIIGITAFGSFCV